MPKYTAPPGASRAQRLLHEVFGPPPADNPAPTEAPRNPWADAVRQDQHRAQQAKKQLEQSANDRYKSLRRGM